MKTKKLTPRNAAPVQRENTATVSRDEGNAAITHRFSPIAPSYAWLYLNPFAGDDVE